MVADQRHRLGGRRGARHVRTGDGHGRRLRALLLLRRVRVRRQLPRGRHDRAARVARRHAQHGRPRASDRHQLRRLPARQRALDHGIGRGGVRPRRHERPCNGISSVIDRPCRCRPYGRLQLHRLRRRLDRVPVTHRVRHGGMGPGPRLSHRASVTLRLRHGGLDAPGNLERAAGRAVARRVCHGGVGPGPRLSDRAPATRRLRNRGMGPEPQLPHRAPIPRRLRHRNLRPIRRIWRSGRRRGLRPQPLMGLVFRQHAPRLARRRDLAGRHRHRLAGVRRLRLVGHSYRPADYHDPRDSVRPGSRLAQHMDRRRRHEPHVGFDVLDSGYHEFAHVRRHGPDVIGHQLDLRDSLRQILPLLPAGLPRHQSRRPRPIRLLRRVRRRVRPRPLRRHPHPLDRRQRLRVGGVFQMGVHGPRRRMDLHNRRRNLYARTDGRECR